MSAKEAVQGHALGAAAGGVPTQKDEEKEKEADSRLSLD